MPTRNRTSKPPAEPTEKPAEPAVPVRFDPSLVAHFRVISERRPFREEIPLERTEGVA